MRLTCQNETNTKPRQAPKNQNKQAAEEHAKKQQEMLQTLAAQRFRVDRQQQAATAYSSSERIGKDEVSSSNLDSSSTRNPVTAMVTGSFVISAEMERSGKTKTQTKTGVSFWLTVSETNSHSPALTAHGSVAHILAPCSASSVPVCLRPFAGTRRRRCRDNSQSQ